MPVVGDLLVWTETLTDDFGAPRSGEAANFAPVTARKPDGTTTFTATIAEIGATGSYRATTTSDAAGPWYLFWHHVDAVTGETTVFSDTIMVDVSDGMTPARAAKLDSLGAAGVTVQSPVAATGDVAVLAGNAYLNADGRALTWTNAAWPSFTSATATMTVKDRTGATVLTKSVSLDSATSIHVDLTATDTTLTSDSYRFAIVATLADVSPATLVSGGFSVTRGGG